MRKRRNKRFRAAGRRAGGRRTRAVYLAVPLFVILFVYAFLKSTGIQADALQTMSADVRPAGEADSRAKEPESTGGEDDTENRTGRPETDAGEGEKQTETSDQAEGEEEEAADAKRDVRQKDDTEDSGYTILYENEVSSQQIPLEQFLIGAIAASIDMEYEPETLKAQAVLLRGNCLRRFAEAAEKSAQGATQIIAYEQLDMPYYTIEELRVLWGTDFSRYYEKARAAAEQTRGVYAKTGNAILSGNYHAMSGGKTRSGKEVLGDEAYDYLQSVPCNKNLESPDFVQTKLFEREDGGEFRILERDSAGYVTKVLWNGTQLGGEQVREALGLASANFEITQGEQYRITTKGIGHGFGFDQYYANYMAKENGKDYMALIAYFFKDISFCV